MITNRPWHHITIMATVHEYIASIGLAFLIYSLPVVAQHSPEYLWQTKAHDNPVLNLALSHQGAFIASIASNGMTHLWNVNNGISVKDFETTTTSHRFGFADYGKPSLTFSLDDKNLAIANSRDMLGFGIDVWNIGDGSLKYRINTSWTPSFAMYSNNGNQIISGEGAYPYFQLSFFNAESGDVESQTSRYYYSRTYFDNIQSVSLSPDGSYIAMCYGYDNDSVPLVMTMTNSVAIRVFNYNVQRCAYSPDGNRIAYCGVNRDSYNDIPGQLLILNPTNLVMERTFIGHQGRAMDLAYSPDGKLLVSCGEDNTIRLWRTGGPCSIIKQKYFELVGTETVTRYRDIQVAEPLITYNVGTDGATCVAFAPNGKSFAYGQTNGNLTLARVPLWVTEAKKDGNQYVLAWQGGVGPYQVQQNETLNADSWQNVGDPTTATGCTNTITSKSTYFRVVDLRTQ